MTEPANADLCPLCEELVSVFDLPDAQRVGGLGGNRMAHRECLLREVLGGIGHLENHAYWCNEMHDPDGGRTFRQSGLEVDAWVRKHGVAATAERSSQPPERQELT